MAPTHIQHIAVLSVAFAFLFPVSLAHSFIVVPKGDFSNFNKAECRQGGPLHAPDDTCKGPCFRKDNWQYDVNEGTTTYARGQKVDMVWTRNNHRGGFVRFTLVPECLRMDEKAHDAYAFRYACYDSDRHLCEFDTSTERRCGTDKYLQKTNVEIPTSLEDGYYILGWAWFGGVDWEYNSFFGDYWSCSRIQIKGGPLTTSYDPVFLPGENMDDFDPSNPMCISSTARLGDCAVEPCLDRAVGPLVPAKFDGKKPAPIMRAWTSATEKCKTPSTPVSAPIDGPRSRPSSTRKAHVTGLQLIEVDTNNVLARSFPKTVYVSTRVMGMTFIASVRGDASAVRFYINDDLEKVERASPYAAFGDHMGKVYPWAKPIFDKWLEIKVVVVGQSGTTHQKTFKVYLKRGTPPKSG